MDLRERTLRVGITVILFALIFRLWDEGLPEKIAAWRIQPNTAAFLTYLETGRNVRFSPSLEAFSPDFVESPPAVAASPELPALPAFSGEEEVSVYYACDKNPDIPALLRRPLEWDLTAQSPSVLILHTHTTESYTQSGEDYEESSGWRTLDEGYNMLSIGNHLAELLEAGGIGVIQDRQLHDYPSYNGSYAHARTSIQSYLEEFPSIQLVLDLHRDASGDNGSQMRTRATVDGARCAQLMVVLGCNHDGYEDNLSLGLKFHAQLEAGNPGITRPLQLRGQRFNQDLTPGALLIEVGAAGNTHAEALLATEQLAKAILSLAGGSA